MSARPLHSRALHFWLNRQEHRALIYQVPQGFQRPALPITWETPETPQNARTDLGAPGKHRWWGQSGALSWPLCSDVAETVFLPIGGVCLQDGST